MTIIPRFIVVDDDPVNNMLCQFGIRRIVKDADISIYTEPEVALDVILKNYGSLEENTYVFLFLDINMPSMTGWEFLDIFNSYDIHLRKRFRIFIVSSSVDQRDKERAGNSELISGFLSKPRKAEVISELLSAFEKEVVRL